MRLEIIRELIKDLYFVCNKFSMKGIYLAAGKAEHSNYNIVYQDITGDRDIGGDMMEVDLSCYYVF